MTVTAALLFSLGICVSSAMLEGVAAGKNVKPFFAKLRAPDYAPPLWLWIIIGVVYYVICFFILFRIFRADGNDTLRYVSLSLLLVAMAINALFNYTFFRLENLFYGLLTFVPYLPAVIGLFICLLQFDQAAAYVLLPYFVYLVYVTFLTHRFWKLNPGLQGR